MVCTRSEMETKEVPHRFNFNIIIRTAQKYVSSGNWTSFKQIFAENPRELLEDFDLLRNTAINVAIRSEDPNLLKELLLMLPTDKDRWVALTRRNLKQNTLLHEVAVQEGKGVGMADVVFEVEGTLASPSTLMEEERKGPVVEIKNAIGETPLFTAAKYGNLKMVKRMAKHIAEKKGDMQIHLRNNRGTILHASAIGLHFDVALWIMTTMDNESSLVKEASDKGDTCLHILSRMPEVFQSQYSMGFFKNLLYKLLPVELYEIEDGDSFDEFFEPKRDLESGQQNAKPPISGVSSINCDFWKYLAKVFVGIKLLRKKKKQHKLAERLAELLVKHDLSWTKSYNHLDKFQIKLPNFLYNVAKRKKQVERKEKEKERQENQKKEMQENQKKEMQENQYFDSEYIPLLVAASNGIKEIVKPLLKEHPEAVNHVSKDGENILHIVVKHRQRKIYNLLKKNEFIFNTLALRISGKNRNILHQVASTDCYRGTNRAGAAFQLQGELKWYRRVEEDIPDQLYYHCNEDKLTAGDVLDIEHDDMLRDAQKWIKETAQSCSTVSVLVSTVVFAAAYTIPGGNSDVGTPVFLRSPVFIFFTIMDVVALALSLASVVMFLSILTSPFELWDFHESLPRKLSIGFAFLFLSLITTMLAFSATILLTIRLQWKDLSSTLVYTAAFFPVTIFGLIQFPLYNRFEKCFGRLIRCSKRWLGFRD